MAENTVHAIKWSPIGAIELKRAYQKNMLLSSLTIVVAVALIVGVSFLIKHLTAQDTSDIPVLVIKSISELGPPPTLAKRPVQVKVSKEIAPPSFNLPEAVPDEEVVEDFVVSSQEELAEITSPVLGDGEGGDVIVDIPLDEYLPTPDEFIPVEDQPQFIHKATPKYPEIARKAGIEGEVWVKVLVDKDGNVRDALIYKESGANAGFEEAALEAAKQGQFRPAMQNKQPVAVWITYPIRFQLKGG